jgi:cell fate regulator YaaT (PSP1 superfamily)
LHLDIGDDVIVETERGINIGRVVVLPSEAPVIKDRDGKAIKKVLRVAREDDYRLLEQNQRLEREAFGACRELIDELQLEMKLVMVEYLHDGSKAVFYFTSENRVDFRELVKRLAHRLRLRIEMRQIGIRDAAGLVGGVGICGRELCCASFLSNFDPVTVKMAKEQGLALNPMKISGLCGRLMCCLGYEYKDYICLKKERLRCQELSPERDEPPEEKPAVPEEELSEVAAPEDKTGKGGSRRGRTRRDRTRKAGAGQQDGRQEGQ